VRRAGRRRLGPTHAPGDTLDTFFDDFPGVTRDQAIAVLEMSRARLLDELGPSRDAHSA
jgi:hypothetical protein